MALIKRSSSPLSCDHGLRYWKTTIRCQTSFYKCCVVFFFVIVAIIIIRIVEMVMHSHSPFQPLDGSLFNTMVRLKQKGAWKTSLVSSSKSMIYIHGVFPTKRCREVRQCLNIRGKDQAFPSWVPTYIGFNLRGLLNNHHYEVRNSVFPRE